MTGGKRHEILNHTFLYVAIVAPMNELFAMMLIEL